MKRQEIFACILLLICSVTIQTDCLALSESDVNKDGFVNLADLAKMASQWLVEDSNGLLPDINIPPDINSPPPDINIPPVVPSSDSHKTFAAVNISALHGKMNRVVFVDDFEDSKN